MRRTLNALLLVTLAALLCVVGPAGQATAQDTFGRDRNSRRTETRVRIPHRPTAYELRCRGASRDVNTTPSFTVLGARPATGGDSLVTVAMEFERGLHPAGDRGEGLRPGQCAWVDRGYGGLEPFTIRFETSANAQLAQMRHGSAVDRSPAAAERFPDQHTIPAYLSDPNHFWVFRAYNTNQGYLQAVSHQHWKPSASVGERVLTGPRDRRGRRLDSVAGVGIRVTPGGLGDSFASPLPAEVYEPPLRPGEVRIVVRYAKEYGDTVPSGGVNYSGCGAFSNFGASVLEPVPGGFGSEEPVGAGARRGGMPLDGGSHWLCLATMSGLPFEREAKVYVRVHSQEMWRTGVWTGGANGQPPAGYERAIIPAFQTVRLSARRPSEVVIFEMVYAPLPSTPR